MSSIRDPRPLQEQAELGANAELLRIYRQLAREQPPAALDAQILAMAAATQPATPVRSRRPAAWLSIAASAVVVVLGAGLAWRMQVEQPLPQTREVSAARTAASGEPAAAASGPTPVPTPAERTAVAAAQTGADGTGRAKADAELGERRSVEVAASEELAAVAAPAVAIPESRPEPAMAPPTVEMAPPPPAATAPGTTTGAAAPVVSAKVRSPLDPEVWLEHVQALLDAGHRDEAVVSLREWRLRYPRHAVPELLQPLLDPSDPAWRPPPP